MAGLMPRDNVEQLARAVAVMRFDALSWTALPAEAITAQIDAAGVEHSRKSQARRKGVWLSNYRG